MKLKTIVSYFFLFYRYLISPAITAAFGIRCRYSESCSNYAERVISEQGLFKGFQMSLRRFLSCNPFTKTEEI